MRIDLHIHANKSRCSGLEPAEVIKKAEEQGLDVIGLVNHDLKPIKYKGSKKVKIIPGVEVSTKQGHILILNTDKEYPKGINAQEAINMAEKKALIIIPHPFDITRKGVGSKLYKLKGYHAIEVNARCLFDYFNKKAIKYSRVHNVPLVAGSDSHFPQEIGNAYITVKAKTIKEAIKKIKQGKNKTYLKKRKIKKKLGPYLKSAIGYTKH